MPDSNLSLKVAIMGTRGIPAAYGGFETFAEELSSRLARRGHRVTVYCRRFLGNPPAGPQNFRGVNLKYLPTIRHKYFETVVHAALSLLDVWRERYQVVLLCNAANSPFVWLARMRGVPVVLNVDGIEKERTKWSVLGRWWYRLGEVGAVLFASSLVADARVIAEYYRTKYRCRPTVIPYGAEAVIREAGEILRRFALRPKNFLLYVSRLEPENNALGVIEAYNGLDTKMPLVIVGDAPYAGKYKALLKSRANANIVFTGFQFGKPYQELRSNCYLYIQATQVGGTHPALVEAMAYGNCIVANSTPEHFEVLGDAGCYYQRNDFLDLRQKLQALLADPKQVDDYGRMAKQRAAALYRWEAVTDQYECILRALARGTA